jgi:glycine betaine catabolism A
LIVRLAGVQLLKPQSAAGASAVNGTLSRTLPGRYFTEARRFAAEMEHFYFGQWICVGREDRVAHAGDFFVCEVAGESIIVTRASDACVKAFFNVCRHRGTRMCTAAEGMFEGRIRCPYHGWTYGLDGRLIGAPHMDQPGFSRADYPLHDVRAETWAGHIFLNFKGNADPIAEKLAALTEKFRGWCMEDLLLHKRITYDVKANWKLIVLNYNECLHCPVLHPALNRLTDYLGADNEPASPAYIGGAMGFRNGAETMSVDGLRRRDYLPGLNHAERRMVCYYAIYPNLLLSLHPDYVMTHTLWPRSADRTDIVCEWHFHPAELEKPTFTADDVIEFWDTTNREDWHISELSQLGISSRAYTPGPYSTREGLLHAFDQVIVSLDLPTASS